jgi:hypothetical protein
VVQRAAESTDNADANIFQRGIVREQAANGLQKASPKQPAGQVPAECMQIGGSQVTRRSDLDVQFIHHRVVGHRFLDVRVQ